MNQNQMPPLVGWSVELPLLGKLVKATYDREFGLTLEGITAKDAEMVVTLFMRAGMAAQQQQQQPPAPRPQPPKQEEPQEPTPVVATPSPQPEVGKEVVTEQKPVRWASRKQFDGKRIKEKKVLSNGGASLLFEDGTGVTADMYGNVVSRQYTSVAELAVTGEDHPTTVETVVEESVQEVVEGVEEPTPEVVEESDDMGITDEMAASVTSTIEYLYNEKGIRSFDTMVEICEGLRTRSPSFSRISDMGKRMRSACSALELELV